MSSTCEISPHEDFSSGRLTDCAAYGKPRSGLERSRVVFTKHGREDYPPMPMQAAQRTKRASTVQDEHVVATGLLGRVVALLRGEQVRARRGCQVLSPQLNQTRQLVVITSYLRMAVEMLYSRDNRWGGRQGSAREALCSV